MPILKAFETVRITFACRSHPVRARKIPVLFNLSGHVVHVSYGHVQDGLSLGRLMLPACLPFSKCQVKALLQVAITERN